MKIARWRCADGRRLFLSQMAESHLINCIRMIDRGHDLQGRVVGSKTRAMKLALEVELEVRQIKKYNNPMWG